MVRRSLVLLIPLALAACQDITPPEATGIDPAFSSSANTVDVIVVLNESFAAGGHGANQSRAEEMARALGVNPRFTYGTALFAATVPTGRLTALRNDPRVDYIDFDAPVSLPDVVACRPGTCGGGVHGLAAWSWRGSTDPSREQQLGRQRQHVRAGEERHAQQRGRHDRLEQHQRKCALGELPEGAAVTSRIIPDRGHAAHAAAWPFFFPLPFSGSARTSRGRGACGPRGSSAR
jgi:hypothetical protein